MCVLHSGWLTFRKSAASCRDYRAGESSARSGRVARKKREVELIEGIAKIFPRLAERPGPGGGHDVRRRAADAGDRWRAMIAKPDLIMLDEPSEGIMPVLVDESFELFRAMKAQGTTCCWSSRTWNWR